MLLARAAGAAAISIALTAGATPADAAPDLRADQRPAEVAAPVLRHAKASVLACRGRGGGFSTATFTAVNRGERRAYAKAWGERDHRMEIGDVHLATGEWGELGELGTTGEPRDIDLHVLLRAGGVTRTKVLSWRDLPRC
jgi:hypothetical protein